MKRTPIKKAFELIALLIVSVLLFEQGVFALSPEQKRLFDSGVYQFDIETAAKCGESSTSITLSGNSNAAKAFNFLVGKGLTDVQAAGVVGNLQAESSIIPNRKQGSGTQTINSIDEVVPGVGFGIAQWTSGGRQENWKKFAEEKGMDPLSLELQLMYLWHELETVPGYGLNEIYKAKDIRQATWIFLVFFERPASTSGYEENPVQPTSGSAKEALDGREALARKVTGAGGSPTTAGETSSPATCESETAGAKLRVSTFNIFHDDKQQSLDFALQRLRRSVDVITSNGLDVVGLQEARKTQQDALMTNDFLRGKYEIFPKSSSGNNFSPNPVIWDSSKWELVDDGSKKFNIAYENGNIRDVATQVKLRSTGCTSSCSEFYFINTHDPAGAVGGTDAMRTANARIYVDMIKELNKEGLPIFLVGDFNSPYKDAAHCIISDSGIVKDTWEIYKDIKGCANGREEGTQIDRIYASPDTTVNRFWSAKAGQTDGNGSDVHATIMADVEIGGEADGIVSANGYTFPLKASRQTILNEKPDPWCATSTKNCHHHYNAADMFAPTGTEVVATRGGIVKSAKDNSVYPARVGSRVTIMGDDGFLYYYAHMGTNTLQVKDNQKIRAGELIGKVGTSENAVGTDPHLHIDRLPGKQYTSRPECSSAGCMSYPFDNIQAMLSEVFKKVK